MARHEIDSSHTTFGFSAKHMVFTTVRGSFSDFAGGVDVEGDDNTQAKGRFVVQTASISTGDAKRDDHLRSADFFDAATYPTITFVPTSIVAQGSERYQVTGDLTMRDVTKPIVLDVTVEGRHAKDAFGKQRIAVSATGSLNRKEWGLNWNMALETGGVLVSEQIKLEIEAAFVAEAVVTAAA